jgi:hypothetical protein
LVAAIGKPSTARDSLPRLTIDETDLTWRVLSTLNVLRLLIAITLIALFSESMSSDWPGCDA